VNPKVFISYSWTSEKHRKAVKSWADRLLGDGVDVIIDVYDLNIGYDKYSFMERSVNDPTVSHVLLISDKSYSTKANDRKSGVGVESTIISNEIYQNLESSKFIPIVCEFDEHDKPCLPVFVNSRIWIDFSTEELVGQNWNQLLRVLFDKPNNIKPKLGRKPAFVLSEGQEQARKMGVGYMILTPFKEHQLDKIFNFLSSDADGETRFDIFVLRNKGQYYWELSELGEEVSMVNDSRLFDIWKLLFLIIPELCGYNKNWILFDKKCPKYPWPLHPGMFVITNEIFSYMTEQLVRVVKQIDQNIPMISNGVEILLHGPRIIADEKNLESKPTKRFVGRSPYVLDTKTGEAYFGRVVFDIYGGEFDTKILTAKEREQIVTEIGKNGCVFILQDAFDSQNKPYNAREVLDDLIENGYEKQ
jgi:hypothetical protein